MLSANEILRKSSAFFRGGARPPYAEKTVVINIHRVQFEVEAICRVLSATERGFITSQAYRAARTRPASARAVQDVLCLRSSNGSTRRTTASTASGRCTRRCAASAGRSAVIRSPG